ncbi:hypothetical protein EMCRGX_G022351 [Ephydatia muelleri]
MFVPRAVVRKPAPQITHSKAQVLKQPRSQQERQQPEETKTSFPLSSVIDTEPNPGPSCSSAQAPSAAGASVSNPSNIDDDDDDEPVLSYSKQQRWPAPGEPVCSVCGRYGAYIVDQTDQDVCSLECKARHLMLMAKERPWHYKEHEEVTQMSDEKVTTLRKELLIEVRGERIPKPVAQFYHLSLPENVQRNLQEAGYSVMTPVQLQTMPAVLMGRDVLVSATTGSGKTLCFLLPLLIRLSQESQQSPGELPRMVILSPTRELCMQIEGQAKQIAKGLPCMKTALLVGGLPIANQLHRLRKGVQILVATPARLIDIITNHAEEVDLSSVSSLVLDEVDSLLHLGFEIQVRQIEEQLPRPLQYLMFSATIPPRIERLATEMMVNPLFISVGVPSAPCDAVKHTVLWVEEATKKKRLFAFLTDSSLFQPPAVIFVNSKMGTVLLADAINKACEGVTAIALHGDMVQERRSAVLQGFLEGKHMCVVATGVLGRGLDLVNVTQVYNFDMPNSITDFIHQIGRAGRLGAAGWATTFINAENKGVFADLVDVLEPLGVQLPPQLLTSPYLALQREQRKRKEQEAQGKGKKRKTAKDLYNSDNLLALIKSASKRRK